jgi:hypothetical protein
VNQESTIGKIGPGYPPKALAANLRETAYLILLPLTSIILPVTT